MSEMTFDGCCPFAFCLKELPHTHPICPECGAVRYGNFFCLTCCTDGVVYREEELLETIKILYGKEGQDERDTISA